ncbi:sensor histidine kinase YesM [Pedobacter cryoconitis]|uniref:Sensor histidine kinase YesM n=1 Tax=Pedobacter cryoconitis TaxID=188932 RepID=A0A7W8ZKI3_9SPHI|nr:sensor histidine kinase [Pedobacter cryoconitis]MBB5635719.1 sensor histidine kinase YesM [Pedobacter cryoconitis]MBB6273407.1 sensor histidine kinase YesM [Pedobacter cryoconitis]
MNDKRALIAHSVYWLIIGGIIGLAMLFSKEPITRSELLVGFGYYSIINISIFYINYTLLIPQLLKRYWFYVISIIVLIILMAGVKTVLAVLYRDIILQYNNPKTGAIEYKSLTSYLTVTVFVSGFFIISSCLIKFMLDWFSNTRIQRSLETEKKDMELQFLKSQLNPHFLFNSLNNIYSLAYQKSDKTADAILKLSEIMRYMIYESNDSWVALSKEIEYVQSYIELQKLRFKNGAAVEMTLNGEIDDQQIIPLILISFVENAFKHGVANDPNDPIRINIIANQKILHFSITNKKSNGNKDQVGGVGLNNVERRLQLLYPERYKLNIVNSATHYTSELMLDI